MTRFHLTSALLSALLLAPEAPALPRKKDQWIQVDTTNFTLYGNASPATVKHVGRNLEQFRAVLSKLTTAELNAPVPTLIYVFSHDRAFQPYKPIRGGKPAALSGMFQGTKHGNYISLDGARRTQATSSIYTLYAYYFLNNNLPDLPLWYRKGLAEYYGTLEIDNRRANIGKPDAGHVRRLRETPMIPLAELFAAQEQPDYRTGDRAYLFDAQCWAVVHYLLAANPERRQQTFTFMQLLSQGMRQDAAFEKAFSTTYDGLQREVFSYIRKFTFGYLRYQLPERVDDSAQVRPLTRADALYRLGDLLVSQYDFRPEAGEHFAAALEEQADHALALAGLGYFEQRQGHWDRALEHYRKAAALAPGDFLIQFRYGDGLLEHSAGQHAAQAVEALRLSVAANPDFAPAWAGLTYAYTFDQEPPPEAVQAAETAHRMLPPRKDVAGNLLLLYVRARQRESAHQLIDRFFARQATDAELAEALAQVAYLDLEQAYDHLRADETAEAQQILDRLTGMDLAGTRIAQQIGRLRQDVARQHFSDRYNEAVDRFNAGDFQAAVTLLEELLPSAPEGQPAEQAGKLLAEIRKQLGDGG